VELPHQPSERGTKRHDCDDRDDHRKDRGGFFGLWSPSG
jgi:hypothetical protein